MIISNINFTSNFDRQICHIIVVSKECTKSDPPTFIPIFK